MTENVILWAKAENTKANVYGEYRENEMDPTNSISHNDNSNQKISKTCNNIIKKW